MTRYKVGDTVRIREDLSVSHGNYHMDPPRGSGWAVISEMLAQAGRVFRICGVEELLYGYRLEGDETNCIWTDEMFDQNWTECIDLDIDENDILEYLS